MHVDSIKLFVKLSLMNNFRHFDQLYFQWNVFTTLSIRTLLFQGNLGNELEKPISQNHPGWIFEAAAGTISQKFQPMLRSILPVKFPIEEKLSLDVWCLTVLWGWIDDGNYWFLWSGVNPMNCRLYCKKFFTKTESGLVSDWKCCVSNKCMVSWDGYICVTLWQERLSSKFFIWTQPLAMYTPRIRHESESYKNVGYQLVDSNQNHIFELKVDEKEEELALPPLWFKLGTF